MALPTRLRASAFAGLCPMCMGTTTMPRSAPEHLRVTCEACQGYGALC